MHPALQAIEHRPWPLPSGPWVWRQQWVDLLFAHWPIPAELVRGWIPKELEVDTFEGQTYIAAVPFRMTGVMRRPFPDLPGLSAFSELNVRLYVRHGDKAGVWFVSLDADNHPAVWAARQFFSLPYHYADIEFVDDAGVIDYRSRRRGTGHAWSGRYRPTSDVRLATPGSLEHWLTERYCLYAQRNDGRLFRTEVHHAPWPLQDAELEARENSLFRDLGCDVAGRRPLSHFSRFIDVVVWEPEAVGAALG